ncbi:MAG: DNA-binding response regulator [Dehalococcoides mccartyi]|uniref:response regulator transcription factor n=1 Tax=Dehalococcoides mccartyi TaxID=61435 RepID=UPI00243100D9|nr:response regulator transcription factor [Dehalococcoides mccartyi]MCF7635228.1 DNA-binding response regulator [Dehalococcoides mccartyi]MEA2122268.1 KDP operon transcriptional regulatory protein KdpE [Dehalococcoides mccartyi]
MKILIIEDDYKIVQAISFALKIGWPDVTLLSASRGESGLRMIEEQKPNLVILDLSLPDMDGLEVLKDARLFCDTPIIILTVRSEESDVVEALELGANEYIIKPFRQMELLARIRCILRRPITTSKDALLEWGPFKLDYFKRLLFINEKTVILTTIESQIMHELLKDAPNIVTYSRLSELISGGHYPEVVNSIKVHVYNLRHKLEADSYTPKYIMNMHGVGYFLSK